MALIKADRVKETSTSTGTGTFALAGAATGYRTFSSVCAIGDTFYYAISNQSNGEWESGLGTYSAANTLTRTTVHASSNSGNAVTFSAGTKEVFVTLTAAQLNGILDTSGITGTLAVDKGGTGATTGTAAAANLVSSAPNDGLEYTLKSKKTNGAVSYYWVDSTGYAPTVDLLFAADRSLTPYSGPTPSFSRASTGTFFNSFGVLTSAAINAARFNYAYNGTSWVSRGLLVEEQRTNTIRSSEAFGNADWAVNSTGGLTVTANSTVAPDGTTTADTIAGAPAVGGAWIRAYPVSVTAGSYTFSVFIKKTVGATVFPIIYCYSSAGDFGIFVNTNTGQLVNYVAGVTGKLATDCGTYWRIQLSGTISSSVNLSCYIYPSGTNDMANFSASLTGSQIYWGAQLEAGSFATSYIPNSGSISTTRSADVCQITGSDFSGFWNATEGAIAAEGDSPASGTRPISSADDNTANESVILFTSGTDPKFSVTDGGVSQADIDAGSISANTNFKLSSALKANDFSASVGGAAAITDASGTVPSVDRLRIGANQAGNYLNGHIARWRYYPVRLPNATLQVLST